MKATHKGHCQACGRLQQLPKGMLSLHGYNVTHGFFSGTCCGARELPFELSCDLVKLFIESAKKALLNVELEQAQLRTPATSNVGYARVTYENPKGRYYPKTRAWELVTFAADVITASTSDNFKYMRYSYTDSRGNAYGKNISEGQVYGPELYNADINDATVAQALLDLTTMHNETYAKWREHEAVNLRRYIAWQQERVDSWKPMPLFANAHKDKEGFVPTAAAY